MKRIILIVISLFVFSSTYAQTAVFHEDFENIDSMVSSGVPTWFQESTFQANGLFSIRDTVALNDTAYLTSNTFSTTGNSVVTLSFNQICKINFGDAAYLEYSTDNGGTWHQILAAQYLGASAFSTVSIFSSTSYGAVLWDPANNLTVPTNAWWKHELFDLSTVIPNTAQAKIRFKLVDGNGSGSSGNYGWLIDDVEVLAAPHELIPPHIAWVPPALQGSIQFLGPFTIQDTITDATGIDSASIFYTINGGATVWLSMTHLSGNIWQGIIPPVNSGDTICYYVKAWDHSTNSSVLPTAGTLCIYATTGIAFPYLDDFESATLWTATSIAGSIWELGTPSFDSTHSAHSPVNCWDVDLDSGYMNNTNTILTSPTFNFVGVYNATLSFWRNHRSQIVNDGAYLQYSTDGGGSWAVLGTVADPLGTNWYNRSNLSTSGTPAWDGNSLGWKQSKYKLSAFNNLVGLVQFRFIFRSNGTTTQAGFSIDDFAIDLAPGSDVGALSIVRPTASAPAGISDTVKVVIKNYGSLAATGFNVSYSINGGTPVPQLYSATLPAAGTDTVTFTTTYAVPQGTFNICAFTSLSGDADNTNDTTCKNSFGIPFFTLPYTDNFDTGLTTSWVDSSRTGTNWQLGNPAFGQTTGTHSGINSWDVNLTTVYGNTARSVLTSSLFDFTGINNAKLSFWQNRDVETGWDGTRLEYSTDGGINWQVLGTLFDPLSTNWYNDAQLNSSLLPAWTNKSVDSTTLVPGWIKSTFKLVPLNSAGPNVRFRFIFTSDGTGQNAGFSIDDFFIIPPSSLDASAISIIHPAGFAAAGASDSVTVVVSNEGTTPISNFNVSYSINGVTTGTAVHANTLAPGANDTISLPSFIVPQGAFSLCAFTELAGDGDRTNDTTCTSIQGVLRFTLPYTDNFDTGTVAWFNKSSVPGTNWQLGTPAFGQTTGSHSAPNCWDVNLTSVYGADARSYLVSPMFDFTGINNARLSFWQNRNVETGWDGTTLQYSTDVGLTWQELGTVSPDPLATNWYNDAQLNSSLLPAWTNTSVDSSTLIPGWIKSTYRLAPLNNAGPNVMFRFLFAADGTGFRDGFSIDDFFIIPPQPLDASAIAIVRPPSSSPEGITSPVVVQITNVGANPISNFPVSYSINGVLSGTATYTGTLAPFTTDTIVLPSFVYPTGNFDICAFTQLTGDGDGSNDTTCQTFFGIPILGVPTFDDLEGADQLFTVQPSNWELGTPASTVIDSAYSPVNAWKTRLVGNYSGNNNDNLYTSFFDFSGANEPELKFWHWYNTEANPDGGRVDISIDGGLTWNTLGSVGDTAATNWYNRATITASGKPGWTGNSTGYVQSAYRLHALNHWTGGLVQFRFNFSSNATVNNNGWAIDNFEIYSPYPNVAPVALSPIINPFVALGSQTQADSVKISNRGSLPINSVDVELRVDGSSFVTDHINYSTPLVPGTSRWHTFSSQWQPHGGHSLCAITSNPNGATDINPLDDTLCMYVGIFDSLTVTLSSPYCNDFEAGNGQNGWMPLNAFTFTQFDSEWDHGTPQKTFISNAHSGSNAWITKLAGNYGARDSSGLFSPVFGVDTVGCYQLSFWHNFVTETYQDGGTVEYSIDNGTSWHLIGFAFETDWFNSPYITGLVGGPPTPGWSGTTNGGWIYSAHYIRFAASGHVIFRFRFGSDLTTNDEGWAIDDVCFTKVTNCLIGINEIPGNTISLDQNFPNPASGITHFAYALPEHGKVRLYITDVLGREVALLANESQDAGMHITDLDVKDFADGMYYCTLEFDNQKMVKKFVVAK